MRIAYLVSRYPLISHVFILREVLALRRAGVQIDTFTIRRAGEDHLLSADDRDAAATTYSILPPSPIRLVGSHARALVHRRRRYLATLRRALEMRGVGAKAALWQIFYFGEAVLMWRECERREIRHIHAHHANVASDVALLASYLGGDAWSWSFTMHGSTEFFDVREHRLAAKTRLAKFVVCVSAHGRSQLMSLVGTSHWEKLQVVHCGLDPALFSRNESRGGDGLLEVLTVGRLVPVKGQTLLMESIAELGRRGVDARLTIVGDGPQRSELHGLAERLGISDRVDLPGAVGQGEIRAYYERADLFALPSFAEGLPVVLMEAMAMELPVVASRITGIPELVNEGISGLLVVPGRRDDLTGALEEILTAPTDRRRQMGRAGREKVLAEFDLASTAAQLKDVFEKGAHA